MDAIFRNPAMAWFLLNLSSSAIIGFTDSSSILRAAALPVLISYNFFVFPTYLHFSYHKVWALIAAAQNIVCVLQYLEIAVRWKWSFNSHGYLTCKNDDARALGKMETLDASKATIWDRLYFGYWCTFAGRLCGTQFEVKHVPFFSAKDPSYNPSRGQFLLQRTRACLLCYIFMDLVTNIPADVEQSRITFAPENVPYLARVGEYPAELIAARIVTTVIVWASSYAIVDLYMNLAALVRVGVGLDDAKFWRPNFGSIRESYSIRRFWG